MAVSVLLRAHDISGEQSYLDAALAASTLMLRPLGSGGCTDYDEAAGHFSKNAHAISPATYSTVPYSPSSACANWRPGPGGTSTSGVAGRLAAQLADYDLGYWSRYDLRFDGPATLAYHTLHVSLLEAAARLFASQAFGDTADRWRSYVRHRKPAAGRIGQGAIRAG